MKYPIYFDNAATTFPKPPSVLRAVERTMRESGGNPGRGSHRLARAAASILYDCRESIADLIGLDDPTRIVFTPNTTTALNIAIKGFLKTGDHVLISDLEHNSVLRPVVSMERTHSVTYSVFSTNKFLFPRDIEFELLSHLKQNTRAVICTHASNLCSRTLPIREIGAFCKKHGLIFIVDAAQSIGHCEIDMKADHITALCAPGHKGLYGPQGSGFLALSDEISEEDLPTPLLEGGSGFQSLLPTMPDLPPERYEAGTASTPMIAGLHAGIRFVCDVGIEAIAEKERRLYRMLRDGLCEFADVTIYAPETEGSVLSFSVQGRPSEEIADVLDESNICVRAGFHCAALAHKALGTPQDSGAVRVGFGYFNTADEVHRMLSATRRILRV